MSKTKVLIFFTADPLGPKVGGAETFIKGFIKYAPEDFDIEFIGITSNHKERPPKRWTRLRLGNNEFNFFPLFLVRDENRKTKIPLALRYVFALKLTQPTFSKPVLFFNRIEPAVLFKKNKFPKVITIHNDIQRQIKNAESEVLWRKFPWLYFLFEKFIFAFSDYIYTVSKNSLEFYKARYSEQKEKFRFISTWVDVDIFYPPEEPKISIRRRLNSSNRSLPIEKKWILFAGRLQEQKAPLRLIDTFWEYYQKDREISLIIIGEGNLKEAVEKYVKKLGLENNVFLLGGKSQEELADFYRASDVLLLTSNFEGMPICVLEALGCGLPVVTTDVGEVKRIVKPKYSGEVVESFSSKIISQFLTQVLNNPEVYSSNNCLDAVSGFTPQEVMAPLYSKIRKLYRERFAG